MSTEDHPGVKLAFADNDECEHNLEFSHLDFRPDVSKRVHLFCSFPVKVPFNCSLNLRTSGPYLRSSSNPSDITLQSVLLSVSISANSTQTLPNTKACHSSAPSDLSAISSPSCVLGSTEWFILYHI